MTYPEHFVAPMREELTRLGFEELRTPDQVDAAVDRQGTVMIVVNSVCGCAAGKARPAIAIALQHERKPDVIGTVFAGADVEATERARALMAPYPPSSPSVALMKDGKLVYMMQRRDIETQRRDRSIATQLQGRLRRALRGGGDVSLRSSVFSKVRLLTTENRQPAALSPARVHLEVRDRAAADRAESAACGRGWPGAPRRRGRPGASQVVANQSRPVRRRRPRRAATRRRSVPGRRIQAQVPQPVGREPAAIARLAERLGGGRDDAEHQAVRQPEAIGRRRRRFVRSARSPRSAPRGRSSISCRDTTRSIDQCVAPPTSMYSMKRTSAPWRRPNSSSATSSSSLTPRITTVSILSPGKSGAAAAMPASTRSSSSERVSALKRRGVAACRG